MESKIRIKMGPIDVEYEGSESFLKQELPELIKTISDLYRAANFPPEREDDSADKQGNAAKKDQSSLQLSTASIASKLGCKSGSDLAIAAAAHLTFVKGLSVFSRQALLEEMKTATSFYKATYSNNLSKTLGTLMKSALNEPSSGKYALTEGKKETLRPTLAS